MVPVTKILHVERRVPMLPYIDTDHLDAVLLDPIADFL
jgi:hypothetical protein